MVPLIDIGVNLGHRRFDADRFEVLARAKKAGVAGIILTGTSLRGSQRAHEMATEYNCFATAGVHPHDAKNFETEGGRATLMSLLTEERVVAIGECGLDFDRDFSPRDVQEIVFQVQIEVAKECALPLFLHERAAHKRLCAVLDRAGEHTPAVVHCFTGTGAELDAYLERDLFIGVTGWICDERRGTHLLDLVGRIPKGRLMIETDAPFLTPRDLRPKPKSGRNEPAFLAHIAGVIANARGETLDELAEHTTQAACEFFGLRGTNTAFEVARSSD